MAGYLLDRPHKPINSFCLSSLVWALRSKNPNWKREFMGWESECCTLYLAETGPRSLTRAREKWAPAWRCEMLGVPPRSHVSTALTPITCAHQDWEVKKVITMPSKTSALKRLLSSKLSPGEGGCGFISLCQKCFQSPLWRPVCKTSN